MTAMMSDDGEVLQSHIVALQHAIPIVLLSPDR